MKSWCTKIVVFYKQPWFGILEKINQWVNDQMHFAIQRANLPVTPYIFPKVFPSVCNSLRKAEQFVWWILVSQWLLTIMPANILVSAGESNIVSNEFFEENLYWYVFDDKIVKNLGQVDIDMFASAINHKLDSYVAWQPDPHALHIDAFTLDWNGKNIHLFDNDRADNASRVTYNPRTAWAIQQHVFDDIIVKNLGQVDIDMFASAINHKFDSYVAWQPDPNALHIDAFTLNWIGKNIYLFPPFSLLASLIHKI